MGPGFLEAAYEEALKVELGSVGLHFQSQQSFPLFYKKVRIKDYVCDLVVDEKVIVEIKAIKKLTEIERAQLLNYLKVTGIRVGLLINFGETSLKHERMIL